MLESAATGALQLNTRRCSIHHCSGKIEKNISEFIALTKVLDDGETPHDACARVQAAQVTSKAIEKCGGAPGFRPTGYHVTWLVRAVR